jgi:hypothetical protein
VRGKEFIAQRKTSYRPRGPNHPPIFREKVGLPRHADRASNLLVCAGALLWQEVASKRQADPWVSSSRLMHHAPPCTFGFRRNAPSGARDGHDRLDENFGSLRVSFEVITASRIRLSQPNMPRAKVQEALRSAALMLRAPCAVAAPASGQLPQRWMHDPCPLPSVAIAISVFLPMVLCRNQGDNAATRPLWPRGQSLQLTECARYANLSPSRNALP